jgi:addiction module RelB/DinJ family antitoxin
MRHPTPFLEQAEGILQRLGLSPTEAIPIFYTQITLRNGLPFDVAIPNDVTIKALEEGNRDHVLSGVWSGSRDCHIEPDWILIYRVDGSRLSAKSRRRDLRNPPRVGLPHGAGQPLWRQASYLIFILQSWRGWAIESCLK